MLSSVRRLVSSELPRMQRSRVPEGPGALVLTEKERVAEPRAGQSARRKTLEARIAELEQAVSNRPDEWEPDGSEDLSQHQPDRIVYKPADVRADEEAEGALRRRSRRLSEIALIETGPANDEEEIAPAATFRHDEAGDGPLQLGAVAAERKAQSADRDEADKTSDRGVRDIVDAATRGAVREAISRATEGDAFAAELADAVAASLEADLADDADPVAEADDAYVAEDADDADLTPVALEDPEAKAAAEAELRATEDEDVGLQEDPDAPKVVAEADQPALPESAVAPPASPAQDTGPMIDAEALRPMVAALIREELQGDLGERITRNVRKLVRQEIQRALTVRELE